MSSHQEAVRVSDVNQLLSFMKAVGVGKKGARNLTRQEADQAMNALLAGSYHPVTFGAFFMGMRFKGETSEELAGFLDSAIRSLHTCRAGVSPYLLNCAGAYDGKARTCNIALPAALVTAAAGNPIALHGAAGIPTKYGMTTGHVLQALGIHTGRSLERANRDLQEFGITYVEQKTYHPAMHDLLPMRQQMGKRTILNTIEILSNPFGASSHLGGFFHDPYAELICRALQKGGTSFQRATLVKGIEGSDELRPGAMFIARLVDADYRTEAIDSDELGVPMHISELSAPTESLDQRIEFSTARILDMLDKPRRESSFRNSVLLNAGIRMYASGLISNLREALALARETLTSGGAGEVLMRWKEANR